MPRVAPHSWGRQGKLIEARCIGLSENWCANGRARAAPLCYHDASRSLPDRTAPKCGSVCGGAPLTYFAFPFRLGWRVDQGGFGGLLWLAN